MRVSKQTVFLMGLLISLINPLKSEDYITIPISNGASPNPNLFNSSSNSSTPINTGSGAFQLSYGTNKAAESASMYLDTINNKLYIHDNYCGVFCNNHVTQIFDITADTWTTQTIA